MRFFAKASDNREQFRQKYWKICAFATFLCAVETVVALIAVCESTRRLIQCGLTLAWFGCAAFIWLCYLGYMHENISLKRLLRSAAMIALSCSLAVHIGVSAAVRPSSRETVNVAIGVFAWKEESHRQAVEDELKQYGIQKVNYSYFDIAEFQRYTEYLTTFGVYEADVLILDENVVEQMMQDLILPLSEADREVLQSNAGTVLQFTEDGNGVLLHCVDDSEYNASLKEVHEWLLFQGDEEFDFGIYINSKTESRDAALQAVAAMLRQLTQ